MSAEFRLVVCGCRDFSDYNLLSDELNSYLKNIPKTVQQQEAW